MYQLKILSPHKELLAFLETEAMKKSSTVFCFTHHEKAANTLSEFILYYLIKEKIDEFVRHQYIKKEEKNELAVFYSSYSLKKYETEISKELMIHFRNRNTFHLEGFVRFGIKHTQKELYNILYASLYDYYEHKKTPSSMSSIEAFFKNQQTGPSLLNLVIDGSGKATLYHNENPLYQDSYANQYAVIGHVIDEKPEVLKVYDPFELLQKEFVILLKKLFRSKVEFLNESYSEDCYL